jgi:hypothetical protein
MILGTFLQTLILLYITYKTNWNTEVRNDNVSLAVRLLDNNWTFNTCISLIHVEYRMLTVQINDN